MRYIFLITLAFLIIACSASPSPTSLATSEPSFLSPPVATFATFTSTPLPPTPVPSATPTTPTLTPTPYLSLTTAGPYLVYTKDQDGQQVLVIMDADGLGRSIMALPSGAELPNANYGWEIVDTGVSPDGKWLAYYTGTAGPGPDTPDFSGPYDLTLNLLNLRNGQIFPITKILSADYPENFRKLDESLSTNPNIPDYLTSRDYHWAFLVGIKSASWSPDSRYLAFAGEMAGPSSDLYLYDTVSQRISRLSSGPEEIQSIIWSPDGKWIVHNSALYRDAGDNTTFHAASTDGNVVKTLSSSNNGIYGWLSPSIYIESDGANGPGSYGLRSVNIETGVSRMIWQDPWFNYVADQHTQTVLLTSIEQFTDDGPLGLYLINLASDAQIKIKDHPFWNIRYWNMNGISFLAQSSYENDGNATLAILADGSTAPIDEKWFGADISPDRQWIITGSEIYTADSKLVRPISISFKVDNSIWRPDSKGEFLLSGPDLYYLAIPDGNPILIDQNIPEGYNFDYTWVSGTQP